MERLSNFERILALFRNDSAPIVPLPLMDAQHALGALLVRTAKADEIYLFEEIGTIDAVLMTAFDLNPVEAAKMRASCELLEKQMPQTEDLARILHYAISEEQRLQAIRALWSVALADGVRHESETEVLNEIGHVLGIPHHVSDGLKNEFT